MAGLEFAIKEETVNKIKYPFARIEGLDGNNVIATYKVFGVKLEDAVEKFGNFAVGQTVGTWIKVPGITDEMIEKYQARVLSYSLLAEEPEMVFLLRVAFPTVNFGGNFATLLTGVLGNDVSTSLEVRLENLEFTNNGLADMGYKKKRAPIEKLREITGVHDRPIILNMIKPCLGFGPEVGAAFFKEVALGGMDMVKDDELLGNPAYNPLRSRIDLYQKASNEAFEVTGKRTIYLPNITDSPQKMREHAKYAVEAGIKACLINFVFTGFDAFAEICREFDEKLLIMGHYAGVGVYQGKRCGVSDQINLGILPRIAGADALMTMYAKPSDLRGRMNYYQNIQTQMAEMEGMEKIVTTIGGGITPLDVVGLNDELGKDIIVGIGGAVQGHPMGTTAGSKAAMDAAEACGLGISLEEMAKTSKELEIAISTWK